MISTNLCVFLSHQKWRAQCTFFLGLFGAFFTNQERRTGETQLLPVFVMASWEDRLPLMERNCQSGSVGKLRVAVANEVLGILHVIVLVPAGTSKSTSRRHCIQAVAWVMAYVADAVTLSSTMHTGGFELGSSALTSSTLKWLHRTQCGFKVFGWRCEV
jgi:hypothetical protein